MRFLLWSGAAVLALALGCGPATRATSRAVDPSTLYVARVRWSPSEISAHGIVPAFPRDSWVALVAADGYVRHARVGGAARGECDDCIGPRVSVTLAIGEPPSRAYAIGPGERRLPRITLLSETPLDDASAVDGWTATSVFDLDENGTADLERVERCGARVPTGCSERVCTRLCAATRTVGESAVRGELCTSLVVVPQPCVPPPPPPSPREVEPEPTADPTPPVVRTPREREPAPGRHWGSRRRPR